MPTTTEIKRMQAELNRRYRARARKGKRISITVHVSDEAKNARKKEISADYWRLEGRGEHLLKEFRSKNRKG